jgi:hypothetical protein
VTNCVFFSNAKSKLDLRVPPIFNTLVATLSFKSVNKICGHLPRFFQTKKCYLPPAAPHEGRRGEEGGEEVSSAAPRGPAGGCGTRTRPAPRTCTHRGEKGRGEIELEFLKSPWGLGTEEEEGYPTGPPAYIGWRNSFLGIDSGAPYTFKNTGSEGVYLPSQLERTPQLVL